MTPRKSKAPAFQFYANDFLTGTQTMTLAAAAPTLRCCANNGIKAASHSTSSRWPGY
jgi:hypothetical protein